MSGPRTSRIQRKTTETEIDLEIDLDGSGVCKAATGIGFFDHMLNAFSRHGLLDLEMACKGDLEVDAHHTIEDTGICLGMSISEALGTKSGISRFGHSYVPMDEALARCCIDLSGRPYLVYDAEFSEEMIGAFPTALGDEFFRSLAVHGQMNLQIDLIRGTNAHHGVEAIFKAVARALRMACEPDPRVGGIPSTKGVL